MPQTMIATDSATELRNLIGDDATATFEGDPTFVDSNPTSNASTENVTVQSDADELADSDEELDDEELDDEEDEEDEDLDDEEDEEEDDDEDDVDAGVEDDPDDDDLDTDKVAA